MCSRWVSYAMDTHRGFRPDVIFVYDLGLPVDFVPRNTDGEVDDFYLWPVDHVMGEVRDSESFKINCALVIVDFLVRHGYISPEEPDYQQIVQGLRPPETWRNG